MPNEFNVCFLLYVTEPFEKPFYIFITTSCVVQRSSLLFIYLVLSPFSFFFSCAHDLYAIHSYGFRLALAWIWKKNIELDISDSFHRRLHSKNAPQQGLCLQIKTMPAISARAWKIWPTIIISNWNVYTIQKFWNVLIEFVFLRSM